MKKNNSGVILIIVLWILAILSLLALSLSKRSSIEISLIHNSVGKLRAYAAARAGVNYVESLLVKSKSDKDTLYQCGIKLSKDQSPQTLFAQVKIDDQLHFDIVVPAAVYGISPKNLKFFYGLQDEQSKINLNAIDGNNYKVFSKLLEQFDINSSDAQEIAAAVVDWHSNGTMPFKSPDSSVKGAKDDYYLSQSPAYKCKNRPFDSIEELLFIRGMTKDLFIKIKDYITIFPKEPTQGLKVNFNTAPDCVIRAIVQGQHESGLMDEDSSDALIRLRNGSDNIPFTEDDGVDDHSTVSASTQMHMNAIKSSLGLDSSQYYTVHSIGTDELTGVNCSINAVIYTSSNQGAVSIVSWQRQ